MSFRDDIERLHDYSRKRTALLAVLSELTEDGIHAQDVESDRTTGTETVMFCWVHEQDPADCNRRRKADDPICTGDPIPKATDPTGETTIRPDRARRLRSEVDRAEARILTAAGQFYDTTCLTVKVATQTCWIYANHDRPRRTDLERRITAATEVLHRIVTEFFCSTCARPVPHPCPRHTDLTEKDIQQQREKLGKVDITRTCSFCGNEPPCTKNPTDVKGNLSSPRTVGRTCYDRIRQTGKPPTRQDLDYLKREGKWPKLKDDPSNGRSAA